MSIVTTIKSNATSDTLAGAIIIAEAEHSMATAVVSTLINVSIAVATAAAVCFALKAFALHWALQMLIVLATNFVIGAAAAYFNLRPQERVVRASDKLVGFAARGWLKLRRSEAIA